MTKSVENTTNNILKRKRKTSTSSSEVEKSLSKSAFPEIDGHITNLVKSKALNHNLESQSEIKLYTQYRFITNGLIYKKGSEISSNFKKKEIVCFYENSSNEYIVSTQGPYCLVYRFL